MPRQQTLVHPRLRLRELAGKAPREEKLLSIRLPVDLLDRLDRLGGALRARKGEIVVALLNEGLRRYEAALDVKPSKPVRRRQSGRKK